MILAGLLLLVIFGNVLSTPQLDMSITGDTPPAKPVPMPYPALPPFNPTVCEGRACEDSYDIAQVLPPLLPPPPPPPPPTTPRSIPKMCKTACGEPDYIFFTSRLIANTFNGLFGESCDECMDKYVSREKKISQMDHKHKPKQEQETRFRPIWFRK